MTKMKASEPKPASRDRGDAGAPPSSGAVYRIQDAARIAGVSPTTVRVWDKNGLVNSYRGSNGYRYFNEEDLQRLRRIAHLRYVEKLNIEGIRRALSEAGSDAESRSPASTRTTPASNTVEVGPRLRKLRQDAGMTLGQAAERAGLSPSFLSALERDQTGVSAQSLHRLAHVYDTTVSAIMRRKTGDLVQLSSERKRASTSSAEGFSVQPLIDGKNMLDARSLSWSPTHQVGPSPTRGKRSSTCWRASSTCGWPPVSSLS